MLTRFLASRFAGPILIALAALALAGGVYGYFQGRSADRYENLSIARGHIVDAQQALISQRDALIASQNAGIANLVKAGTAGREVYLTTYAKADERASDHDDRAADLLALTITQTDELAQCRAAKLLLEEELLP